MTGTTEPGPRHRACLVGDTLLAVSALGGALGFWTGSIPADAFGGRLPGDSVTLAGAALAVVVAVPAAVAAAAVWARRPWAPAATQLTGGVLIAWIAAQVAIIGFVSALQPVMALWGAGLLVLGHRARRAVAKPR